jgi:hypothetical protein
MSGYDTAGLPVASSLTGAELISTDTQTASGVAPQTVAVQSFMLDAGVQFLVPTAGQSLQINNNVANVVMDPAGTLATLTLLMPLVPVDGQHLAIASTQTITALTLTPQAGATIAQNPTAITVSTTTSYGLKFIWRASVSKWIRLQ